MPAVANVAATVGAAPLTYDDLLMGAMRTAGWATHHHPPRH